MNVGSALILRKENTRDFVASLLAEMRVVAPKEHFRGDVMFADVQSPNEVVWEYTNDPLPPKRYVQPERETLFRYRADGKVELDRRLDAPRQAILGIRSCDVVALRQLERFFAQPITDPNFTSRAQNTVLFSLVCNSPREECFCICCDAGPYLTEGYDVQLTDLGDRFLYEIGSEKGLEVSRPRSDILTPASEGDLAARRRIEIEADAKFQTTSYIAKAITFISANEVPEKVWDDLGATCFRCGNCTNLCPVCTCFTVEDVPEGDGWYTRLRCWDSCQLAGFTREASGFNPRASFGKRVQRRFFHKASYQYITRDGRHGCVGCGRCTKGCLADLGLPSAVRQIRRAMHAHLGPVPQSAEV
ncbi:MAG: 4Fe-4S dicluster domain-containing protein [Armatimonadota bacterium]